MKENKMRIAICLDYYNQLSILISKKSFRMIDEFLTERSYRVVDSRYFLKTYADYLTTIKKLSEVI